MPRVQARGQNYTKRQLASLCLSVYLTNWLAGWLSVCPFIRPHVKNSALNE